MRACQRGLRACQRGLRSCQRGLRACHRGLRTCQRGLRACQRGLKACQRGLRACQRGLRACQRGLRACQEAHGEDVRMEARMHVQNFSPFYRTSSPLGATAQKGAKLSFQRENSHIFLFPFFTPLRSRWKAQQMGRFEENALKISQCGVEVQRVCFSDYLKVRLKTTSGFYR